MWFVPVFLTNSNCLNSNLDRNIGGRSSQGHLLFFKRLSFGLVLTHCTSGLIQELRDLYADFCNISAAILAVYICA